MQNKILDYWFGTIANDTTSEPRNKLWFGGGEKVDNHIRDTFEPHLIKAANGELDDWSESARGTLSLIILLDQFPLNMYRKTAKAYDFEARALNFFVKGLTNQFDMQLSIIERTFFYLPLEHSENTVHQKLSVELFTKLYQQAPDNLKKQTQSALDYAVSHKHIIDIYGRFPHRNKVLGRQSTSEEIDYLESNGDRFGQ